MKTLTNPREARGLEILSGPENIKEIQPNVWYVQSQSKNGYYRVTRQWIKTRHQWRCDGPDCTYRKVTCKHIYAVQFSLKLKEEIEKESTPRALVSAENNILCPACQSVNIVKYGCRKTTFGEVQRFGCKDCGYKFTEDKGFKHMKHDPKVITLALDLYFKGVSLRKIADHLKQFHDIPIAQTTPMRWIKKYLKLLSKYVEKNQVDVGKIWHSDEMTVFIKKNGEKKYYEWIWNIMDSKTRYLLTCQVTKNRYVEDAKKPLKQAKKSQIRDLTSS
jgi:putative transposase